MRFFLATFLALAGLREQAFGFSLSPSSSSPSKVSSSSSANSPTTALHMATWSDSKAVKEYQDFLESGRQTLDHKDDGPSIIIAPREGPNALTEALVKMGNGDDLVLTQDDELPDGTEEYPEYPVYITLPPSEIHAFCRNMSPNYEAHEDDFVFFSGGMEYGNIEDVLKENGMCRDATTQVLLEGFEFTKHKQIKDVSTKLGTDAMGKEKWAGECAACGKWNGAIAKRLERNEVRCNVDFYRDWRRRMWERSILDAVFHLVGSVREKETSISDVALYYESEASDLIWEISQELRGWKAVTLTYGVEERVFGIAENRGSKKPCILIDSAYDHVWGNKVFTGNPMFAEYLWYAKDNFGLLQSVELPNKRGTERVSSIMRKGNLRADGVI